MITLLAVCYVLVAVAGLAIALLALAWLIVQALKILPSPRRRPGLVPHAPLAEIIADADDGDLMAIVEACGNPGRCGCRFWPHWIPCDEHLAAIVRDAWLARLPRRRVFR